MTAASYVPIRSERSDTASSLSPRQMEALRTFAETGDQRTAARDMGISLQTFKNHLRWAYHALGVHSSTDAFRKLGWLRTPNA